MNSLHTYTRAGVNANWLLRDGWILDETLIPRDWAGVGLCTMPYLMEWAAYVVARD